MDRPINVYAETSVWSFVFADDAPDYRAQTLEFFDRCRSGILQPIISGIVIAELARSREPLQSSLLELLREIRPVVLAESDEAM